MHIYIKTHGFILLSMNGRERERSSFVYFVGVQRTRLALLFDHCLVLIVALQFSALQSLLIHPHPCSLVFALFLSDLITFVYICRAAPCFSSLIVCLCGRGLVRANRHTLSATLGLGVLPSCLKSNQARTRLLACSS